MAGVTGECKARVLKLLLNFPGFHSASEQSYLNVLKLQFCQLKLASIVTSHISRMQLCRAGDSVLGRLISEETIAKFATSFTGLYQHDE
jgi:hypothetical protein